jgi:hypothetical protein
MSSTDADRAEVLIRRFHEEQLVPLAERLAVEGRAPFPLAPDPLAATYWEERSRTTMAPADFEVPGSGGPEELEAALAALWTAQGWPELAPLAPALAEIAAAAREAAERTGEDDGEVSPFLYAMF